MAETRCCPGKPYPLGATWDGHGVNFAIYSENSQAAKLLLFDKPEDKGPSREIQMTERTAFVWHTYVPGADPGQLYGYRVYGPYEPQRFHRFNPAKFILDPYARAVAGDIQWNDAVFGYRVGDRALDLSKDDRDSTPYVPKCLVVNPTYDWEGDTWPRIPWSRTIFYELHVRGFTMRHPGVEEHKRGTYAGLASQPVIDYLKNLGVTAVELMPVHQFVSDKPLADKGLSNYWGYNTIAFFAPHWRYSSSGVMGQQIAEFRDMVKALHKARIEVILDVVYNHTGEGNQMGPTVCFRGMDNAGYYRSSPDNPRYYMDFTGTGNTPNMTNPRVLQIVMDSLRYWVVDMHVDGFRFDLASTLARELYAVDRLGSFFDIIQQDPVLNQVKLVAEPWDVGVGGYQVGNFPPLWAEWNGKYRDCMRRFWKGDDRQMREVGYRLTGSSDLYERTGRKPYASINFITSHDGFTLNDLVSYNSKHNEANLDENRDGMDSNDSWNCGVEGPTDDPGINELRERQKRNFLATLVLSQGTPMLHHGDEVSRTQNGNNNVYCQDNPLSWFDWNIDDRKGALLEFTKRVIKLKRDHPIFRRRTFFQGRPLHGLDVKDITWYQPDANLMTSESWAAFYVRTVGMMLAGDEIDEIDANGKPITDDTMFMILNAHWEQISFTLPNPAWKWELILYTAFDNLDRLRREYEGTDLFAIYGRSLALFRRISPAPTKDIGGESKAGMTGAKGPGAPLDITQPHPR